LKSQIFITAGQRPAVENAQQKLPERQNLIVVFPPCLFCRFGQMFSVSRYRRQRFATPTVIHISPLQGFFIQLKIKNYELSFIVCKNKNPYFL
jgi:hypothetical protein